MFYIRLQSFKVSQYLPVNKYLAILKTRQRQFLVSIELLSKSHEGRIGKTP